MKTVTGLTKYLQVGMEDFVLVVHISSEDEKKEVFSLSFL